MTTPLPNIAASLASPTKKARVVNSTDAAFLSPPCQAIEPFPLPVANGRDGVIVPPTVLGGWSPTKMMVSPYGTGADNSTASIRVIGWREAGDAGIWVPVLLFESAITLCAFVGLAGKTVLDTERFADTIADPAAGFGTKGQDCWIVSPANDTPAHFVVDCKGCQKLEILVKCTTATALNALVTWV